MSDHSTDLAPAPPAIAMGFVRLLAPFAPSTGAAVSATTYYYRTSGGARSSTADAGSIPAGAVVERVA